MPTVERAPKCLVHSYAGPWHFTKAWHKSQYWNQKFIKGWCMVWRSLSDNAFSETKQLLVGSREQLRKKIHLKVSHSTKSMKSKKIYIVLKCIKFLFEKFRKTSSLVVCFSEIPKLYICVCVRQMTFLSEDWKKLSVWSSVLFAVSTLKMHERKPYIKQTGLNVSVFLNKVCALENGWFLQVSHTVS